MTPPLQVPYDAKPTSFGPSTATVHKLFLASTACFEPQNDRLQPDPTRNNNFASISGWIELIVGILESCGMLADGEHMPEAVCGGSSLQPTLTLLLATTPQPQVLS